MLNVVSESVAYAGNRRHEPENDYNGMIHELIEDPKITINDIAVRMSGF